MARINQLVNSATLNATDVLAKDAASGGTTNKITAQDLANGIKSLGSLVNTTEMNAAIAQSTAFVLGTNINDSDLNTITTPGKYYSGSTGGITNLPVRCTALDLIVIPRASASRCWQIALCFDAGASSIWYRAQSGASTFDPWVQM